MSKIGMREMLEAGAHFGHQTHRWNPKMSKYIFCARNGIHIIDLQQTVGLFRKAYEYVSNVVAGGGKVLFVSTKKQAQDIVAEQAQRANQFYVNSRWLGGTLTNFKTIRQSIDRLKTIEKMMTDGTMDKITKKEAIKLSRESAKLEKNLSGIKDMSKPPKVVFVIDPNRESIAVLEAVKLNIKVIATLDTNCNPDLIDYKIPANDDSMRSISLFVSKIADACLEGQKRYEEKKAANAESKKAAEEESKSSNEVNGTTKLPKVEVVQESVSTAVVSEPSSNNEELAEPSNTASGNK